MPLYEHVLIARQDISPQQVDEIVDGLKKLEPLADSDLLTLFNWSETEFLTYTEGSAIRRIGYEGWLRNLAVGLGNAPSDPLIIAALERKRPQVSDMVQEHIDWALAQQAKPARRRKRKIHASPTDTQPLK